MSAGDAFEISPPVKAGVPAGSRKAEPWFIVLCCVLGTAVGGSTMAGFGLGGFLKDIVRDLNWTRSGASNAISLYLIGLGTSGWLTGIFIDRFGVRRTAIVSIILMATLLAGVSMAQTPLWLQGLCLLMGLVAGGTTSLPYMVVISARFSRNRGLALGLGSAGAGLGGVILPLIVALTAESYGWRAGMMIIATAVLAIAVPAGLIGLRLPRAMERSGPHVIEGAVQPLFKSRSFWLIAGAIALATFGVGAAPVQAIALLTDRGIDRTDAAWIISALSLASIAGRIISGTLMDRYFAPYVAAAFFLVAAVGLLLILTGANTAVLSFGFILVGLTLGAESDISGYHVSRYLPRQQHGRAIGLLVAAFSLSNALGVSAFGYSFDLFGSYAPGLLFGVIITPLAALLIARLGPYSAAVPSRV